MKLLQSKGCLKLKKMARQGADTVASLKTIYVVNKYYYITIIIIIILIYNYYIILQ